MQWNKIVTQSFRKKMSSMQLLLQGKTLVTKFLSQEWI